MLVFGFNSLRMFKLTDKIFVNWVDMSQFNVLDNVGTLSDPRGSQVEGMHQTVGCLGSFGLNLKLRSWGLKVGGWGYAPDFCIIHYSHNDKDCIRIQMQLLVESFS
jgi:hypothetical protein